MAATRASNDRPPGAGGVKRGRPQQEAATTGSRVTVVLGAQWGDEGKGKVVDLLATDADIISRCQVRGQPPAPDDPAAAAGDTSPAPPPPARTHSPPCAGRPFPRGPASPTGPTPTRGPGQSYKYKSC